jgi:hypothetical protein
LCYHENDIGSEKATKLAGLVSLLVDSRKAGLQLTDTRWREIRKEISPRARSPPAYRESDGQRWNSSNIIDYLKFQVVGREKDRILTDFKTVRGESGVLKDKDLTDIWKKTWERALSEKDQGKPQLFDALVSTKQDVQIAYANWARATSGEKMSYADRIGVALESLQEVQPRSFDHELSYTWKNSEDEWVRLRASCVYKHYHSKFPWYSAGMALCDIKARATGSRRTVVWDVYCSYRVSRKIAKRIEEEESTRGEDSEYEDDDVFLDANEQLLMGLDGTVDDGSGDTDTDASSEEDWVSLA